MLFTFDSNATLVIDSLKNELRSVSDPIERTKLLLHIGNEYIDNNRDSARLYLDIAEIQLMDNPNTKNSANYYKFKGLLLNKEFKNNEAISHLKTGYNLFKELNSTVDLAIIDNLIANCYNDLNLYDSAIHYYMQSAKNIDSATNPALLATNYNNVANVYDNLGEAKKTLNYYLKALPLFEKLDQMENYAITTNNIGIIFLDLEQQEKAIGYFKKAAKINLKAENIFNLCNNYNSLGIAFKELQQYDSATYYTLKANDIADNSNYEYLQAQSGHNLASIYLETGDLNSAVKFFKLSLKICNKLDINKGKVFNMIGLGTAYTKLDKFELADNHLVSGLKLCRELNFISQYDKLYNALTANYKAWGKYKEALNYYQKYVGIKDSIDDLIMEQELNEIQTKYETEQKELENQRLKDENELQNMVILRQRLTLAITILVAAIAILGVFLLIYFRLKKKRRINMLEEKNRLIREKSEQLIASNQTKDKLFSIIAHDLRSPFTSLLGFASLIKEEATAGNTKKVLLFTKQLTAVTKNTFELLDNLLNWSRSQHDTINTNPQNINLYNCVGEITGEIKEKTEEKNIVVKIEVDESLVVNTDENILKVILRNLLSNALKFTRRGGLVIIGCNDEINEHIIMVQDNGIGMTTGISDSLFTDKPVISAEGTENEQGSGLGLMLVKDFVTRTGGRIWVTSEPSKGSTFYFTIPKNNN